MAFCTQVEDVISKRNVVTLTLKELTQQMHAMGELWLYNCINWVESSSWDGRYGLVVCTDSVMGQLGQLEAQLQLPCCSGQMLLAFERKFRRSHMSHAYDFDKPNLANGKLSQTCYLMVLDFCYKHFCEKFEKLQGRTFSISDADYFVFRSPSNKLVQKCFAWLFFNDFLRNASYIDEGANEKLPHF